MYCWSYFMILSLLYNVNYLRFSHHEGDIMREDGISEFQCKEMNILVQPN